MPSPSPSPIGDLCWLGTSACGSVTWDFSFWDIVIPLIGAVYLAFVSIVVTGIVTGLTIYFSVREARKATQATLNAQRAADGVAAIADVVLSVSITLEGPPAPGHALGDPLEVAKRFLAVARIRASGIEHAGAAAEWVDAVIKANRAEDFTRPSDNPGSARWHMVQHNPSGLISRRLTQWASDPTKYGRHFPPETAIFLDWFNESQEAWDGARRVYEESANVTPSDEPADPGPR